MPVAFGAAVNDKADPDGERRTVAPQKGVHRDRAAGSHVVGRRQDRARRRGPRSMFTKPALMPRWVRSG